MAFIVESQTVFTNQIIVYNFPAFNSLHVNKQVVYTINNWQMVKALW